MWEQQNYIFNLHVYVFSLTVSPEKSFTISLQINPASRQYRQGEVGGQLEDNQNDFGASERVEAGEMPHSLPRGSHPNS